MKAPTDATVPWLETLLAADDETLNPEIEARILADGEATVLPLIAVIEADLDDPSGGWAGIHAAGLLRQLRDPRATPVLLRVIDECDVGDVLLDQAIFALGAIGKPAVEPILAHLEGAPADAGVRVCLHEALEKTGVRDERIFAALAEGFSTNPEFYAGTLGEYGDKRGLPILHRAFDAYTLSGRLLEDRVVLEFTEAIETLGGVLTEAQREKLEEFRAGRAVQPGPQDITNGNIDRSCGDLPEIGTAAKPFAGTC